jgi:hypothetical protein
MKQFILLNIVLSIVIGFLGPWSTLGIAIQEPQPSQPEYESPLKQARNDEQAREIEPEAEIKDGAAAGPTWI